MEKNQIAMSKGPSWPKLFAFCNHWCHWGALKTPDGYHVLEYFQLQYQPEPLVIYNGSSLGLNPIPGAWKAPILNKIISLRSLLEQAMCQRW